MTSGKLCIGPQDRRSFGLLVYQGSCFFYGDLYQLLTPKFENHFPFLPEAQTRTNDSIRPPTVAYGRQTHLRWSWRYSTYTNLYSSFEGRPGYQTLPLSSVIHQQQSAALYLCFTIAAMSRSALWKQEGRAKERESRAEELFQSAVEEGRARSKSALPLWGGDDGFHLAG